MRIIHTGISADLAGSGKAAVNAMIKRVTKPALLHGVKTFHKKRYAKRFGSENARYTTARTKKYQQMKEHLAGAFGISPDAAKRMVFTGDLRRRLTGPGAQVRFQVVKRRGSNKIETTMFLTGARKINAMHAKNRKMLGDELTKMMPADDTVFNLAVERMAERQMRKWNKSGRRVVKRK